jgi:hypothetical protein
LQNSYAAFHFFCQKVIKDSDPANQRRYDVGIAPWKNKEKVVFVLWIDV